MSDFFGNLATFLGGVVGGGIGFLIIAFVILIGFIPLAIYMRQGPTNHTGLESFNASLDTPDEGWNDRIPDKTPDRPAQVNPSKLNSNYTNTNNPTL